MAFAGVKIAGAVLYAILTGIFSRPKGMPFKRHVASAFLRARGRYFVRSEKNPFIGPDTTESYREFAKSRKFEPNVIPLGQANGLWIGSPKAKIIVLYFHGGAYVSPAVAAQFALVENLIPAAKSHGKELAVFALAYQLGHEAKYPTQIQQARDALAYLLETTGLSPADIILGGDSAGGNLVAGLLLHLSRPHPQVSPLDLSGQKLRGAFLISPWIGFNYDTKSARENQEIDFLSADSLRSAATTWLGSAKPDEYNAPLTADPSLWKGVKTDSILVTGGTYEYLADDIETFAKNLQVHNPSTEIVMGQYEIHVQPVMDTHMKLPMTVTEKALHDWLKRIL